VWLWPNCLLLPCCCRPTTQVSRIPKWQPKGITPDARTAINTEWGCYGSNLLPRVKEDLELDAASGPQQGAQQPDCIRVVGDFSVHRRAELCRRRLPMHLVHGGVAVERMSGWRCR
jgi:hypothetical protein